MRENPEDRNAILAAAMGQYIRRQVDEDGEERAQRKIAGLLNGWREVMADREGIMSRNDGSELGGDELRVPQLSKERRSPQTRDHPPEHVTAPEQADHAIGMFHNLMFGLDSMVMNDSRDRIRLHLTAEYVIIRALLEAATTACGSSAPTTVTPASLVPFVSAMMS